MYKELSIRTLWAEATRVCTMGKGAVKHSELFHIKKWNWAFQGQAQKLISLEITFKFYPRPKNEQICNGRFNSLFKKFE